MLRKLIPFLLLLLSVSPAVADNHLSSGAEPLLTADIVVDPNREIQLGSEVYRGVVATAQLKWLPEPVEGEVLPPDKSQYLLTVSFSKEKSSKIMPKGDVAVKITSPDEVTEAAIRLIPTEGAFQAAVLLDQDGESLLKIGSKLPDEKKRIYRFFFTPGL